MLRDSRAAPFLIGTGQPHEGKGSVKGKGGFHTHLLIRRRAAKSCPTDGGQDDFCIGEGEEAKAGFPVLLMSISIISQNLKNKQYFFAGS